MKNILLSLVVLTSLHFVTIAQPSLRAQMQADHLQGPEMSCLDSTVVWKPFNLPTVGIQILTGTGGWMVGGIASLPFQAAGGEFTSFLLLGGVGFASGVYLGGKWMGGNGEFVPTVLYPAIRAVAIVGIIAIAGGKGGRGVRGSCPELAVRSFSAPLAPHLLWAHFWAITFQLLQFTDRSR